MLMQRLSALLILPAILIVSCSPKPGEPGYVVAQVEGKKITQAELDVRSDIQIQRTNLPPEQLTDEIKEIITWRALNEMVMQEIIHAAAKEIDKAPLIEQAETQYNQVLESTADQEAFLAQLEEQGLTPEIIKQEIVTRGLFEQLVSEKMPEGINITDEQSKAFYDQNPQMFQQPERVTARHILIRTAPTDSDEAKKAAKKKIDAARKRVVGGEDFAAVATEVSEDPGSGARGGMLPPFGKGQMVPPFEKIAFESKKGDVSQVFESQFGYHFIEKLDHSEEKTLTFDEVNVRLKQSLAQRAQGEMAQQLIQELQDTIEHEYFIEDPTKTEEPAEAEAEAPAAG
ncbi:MAG: peptidylprolyl isomerase [Verrucomicrobiota bacterium]